MQQNQIDAEQKLNFARTLPPTEASTHFKVPSVPVRAQKSKIPTLKNGSGSQSKIPIKMSAGKENNFLTAKESKHSNSE